jgi:hypothetical protein
LRTEFRLRIGPSHHGLGLFAAAPNEALRREHRHQGKVDVFFKAPKTKAKARKRKDGSGGSTWGRTTSDYRILQRYDGTRFERGADLDDIYEHLNERGECVRSEVTMPYAIGIGAHALDGLCARTAIAYANAADKQLHQKANADLVTSAYVVNATIETKPGVHVHEGDEILVSYGASYHFGERARVDTQHRAVRNTVRSAEVGATPSSMAAYKRAANDPLACPFPQPRIRIHRASMKIVH